MYDEELKELGFTENESKVYLSLLKNGMLNPTHLAQKTGLHRSYIYDTLERLLEMGMVSEILVDGKRHFQAADPKMLREIFEIKLNHLESIIPQLYSLKPILKDTANVELFRGKTVYRTLIKDILSTAKNDDIVYVLGADENKLETVEPIYLKRYFNLIKQKKITERIIISKGGTRLENGSLQYREFDTEFFDETTTVIYQNKVFIFVWGEPYYLIKIGSQKVADSYRKQFLLLWKVAHLKAK